MGAKGSTVNILNHVKETCSDLYITRFFLLFSVWMGVLFGWLFGWLFFGAFLWVFFVVVFFPHLVYANTNSFLALLYSSTTPGLISWESLMLPEFQGE